MSLPALVKTWQHNVDNQTLALGGALLDNQTTLLGIKNALVGVGTNPWVVRYSCSSTVAGTAGDGVDRIAVATNWVWGNAGSAHSWIALRQTGIATNFELLISCEGVSATGVLLTIAVSPSAAFTGGTTTARPTATDEIVLLASATWGVVGADISQRWSVMQSTDGQSTRVILCNSGDIRGYWILEKPINVTTGWTNPSVCFVSGATNLASVANLTTSATATAIGRMRNGAICNVTMTCEGIGGAGPFPSDVFIGNIANEIDNAWMMLPIGIAGLTAGNRGRHGTLNDLWLGSTTVVSGDTYPNTGTNLFAQFGNLIVPWNGGGVHLS